MEQNRSKLITLADVDNAHTEAQIWVTNVRGAAFRLFTSYRMTWPSGAVEASEAWRIRIEDSAIASFKSVSKRRDFLNKDPHIEIRMK